MAFTYQDYRNGSSLPGGLKKRIERSIASLFKLRYYGDLSNTKRLESITERFISSRKTINREELRRAVYCASLEAIYPNQHDINTFFDQVIYTDEPFKANQFVVANQSIHSIKERLPLELLSGVIERGDQDDEEYRQHVQYLNDEFNKVEYSLRYYLGIETKLNEERLVPYPLTYIEELDKATKGIPSNLPYLKQASEVWVNTFAEMRAFIGRFIKLI